MRSTLATTWPSRRDKTVLAMVGLPARGKSFIARKIARGVSGRSVTQIASRGRTARSSGDQPRIERFFKRPISVSALRISGSCGAGKCTRTSIENTDSSSWSYIWISAMFAPKPVTECTIGSASPRLSGPTAVMTTCMAGRAIGEGRNSIGSGLGAVENSLKV